MVLDAHREGLEVGELELASCGAEERVLLVDRLERRERERRQAKRGDRDGEPAAGTDIEDTLRGAEVGNGLEAVADVGFDLVGGACSREVDATIPLKE